MNTQEIKDKVIEKLKESPTVVSERVIDVFAKEEENKRVELVVAAIRKLDTLKVEFKKFKADNVTYDTEGKEIMSGFSKANLDKFNKAKSEIEKLDKLITLAVLTMKTNMKIYQR